MGDEQLNPYLPKTGNRCGLAAVTGDDVQADIETSDLYKEASQKFNIYHLDVKHHRRWDDEEIPKTFKKYLDDDHFKTVNMDSISDEIVDIILKEAENNTTTTATVNNSEITW